jgi:Holliday junction DNA helicase RuvA
MIALLRGRPAYRAADAVVFDVNGVGYLVYAPAALVARLPEERESTLHISTIVREDALLLYGFEAPETRDAFDMLRQVNGVGPRTALSLLSALSHEELVTALASGDARALSRAPGVGRKLAERLCLELDGKIPRALRPPPAPAADDPLPLALARLEYKKSEIDRALASDAVPAAGQAPLETRLRAALQVLMRPL